MNEQRRYGVFFLFLAGALIILLGVTGHLPTLSSAGADDPGPRTPENCTHNVEFKAYGAPSGSHFFGASVEGIGADNQYRQMLDDRCVDPVMTAAHMAYETRMWGNGDADFNALVYKYINDPSAWLHDINQMIAWESDCDKSNPTMSGNYQTLAQNVGSNDSVVPTLFQTSPSRPSFEVLRLSCPNFYGSGQGRVLNFKTNCRFQPVAVRFPGISHVPIMPTIRYTPPSGHTPGTNPPGTTPTTGCTHNCTTTSTTPTTTPTTGCPTGPDGCKDPTVGINNDPGACSLGDCGPRPVNPEPPPPDPVQPTATVAPPRNPPPPPSDPGPTQPPVTSTVPSPVTVPE